MLHSKTRVIEEIKKQLNSDSHKISCWNRLFHGWCKFAHIQYLYVKNSVESQLMKRNVHFLF